MQLPKIKFIDSMTDLEARESQVVVSMLGKDYIGSAKCHPEESWSEFVGCRYAETRAEIAALKDLYRQKKNECDSLKNFVKSLECYKNFDKESSMAKIIYRQLNIRVREVNRLAEEIGTREFNLLVSMRQQDRFNEKMKSKKDN